MGAGGGAPSARDAAITRAALGDAGGDPPAAWPPCGGAAPPNGSVVHDPREPSEAAPAASTQVLETVWHDHATEGCAALGAGLVGAAGVGLSGPPSGGVVDGREAAQLASPLGDSTSPGAAIRADLAADSQELPSADGAAGETARTAVGATAAGGPRGPPAGGVAGGAGPAPGGRDAMVGPLLPAGCGGWPPSP